MIVIIRLVFWLVFATAVSLIVLGISQLAQANTKQAAYTETWCDKLGGSPVTDNDLIIPCLTKTHAIFRESEPLVKYMIEYGDKYEQIPALIIKEK